ncbi:MAG: helix-turn-helix domain-containing protein [Vulcanibacillus sp.]
MNDSRIIGEKIRSLRNQRNITQQTLAEQLNVSPQAVSRWENGDSYPDLEQIVALSSYFKITTDELLKNNVKEEITEYPIYELVENENLIIDVTDIRIYQGITISLSVTNKTSRQIHINPDNFLLMDIEGTTVKAKTQPITDYDGYTISSKPLHELPPFIPPYVKANIVLMYEYSVNDYFKLWINIDDVFLNKAFIIKSLLILQRENKNDLRRLVNDDKAYYFNYLFKYNKLTNYNPNLDPKISVDIIPLLLYKIDDVFIRNHLIFFEEDTLKQLIIDKKYFDLNLVRKLFDIENQKAIIKKNFDIIENQIISHNTSILSITGNEDFLDQEIIEKIIQWYITYVKDLKEWHYKYINDDFYKKNKKIFEILDFRK